MFENQPTSSSYQHQIIKELTKVSFFLSKNVLVSFSFVEFEITQQDPKLRFSGHQCD